MCSASQPSSRRHGRGDAQREALLAEQRVAAVAAAVATRSRGPRGSGRCTSSSGLQGHGTSVSPSAERRADGVHAGHERAVGAERVEHGRAHAGHDPHVDRDVGRVGDLDADLRDRRTERAHAERDHVHRAAPHAAVEQAVEVPCISAGSIQLLVGPASLLRAAADEGAVLDPGDVARVGAGEEAVRSLLLVEPDERAGVDQFLAEFVVFLGRSVAPVHVARSTEGRPSRRPRLAASRSSDLRVQS